MPTATSMAGLKAMLMKEMTSAMNEAESKSLEGMQQSLAEFYGGGSPKEYERTGMMGNTPITTGVLAGGSSASFTARLSGGYSYDTGSNPSGDTVLNWAEAGGAGIVGAPGFWAKSEERIEQALNSAMSSHFG